MVHYFSQSLAQDWTIVPLADGEIARYIQGHEIPAWSLHRLIEMAVESPHKYFTIFIPAAYDDIISHIEWLIKEGYFNKEYLWNDTNKCGID